MGLENTIRVPGGQAGGEVVLVGESAEDLLAPARYGGGILDVKPAQEIWRKHIAGEKNYGSQLWTLLSFEAWRRQWVEPMHRRPAWASNVMAITAGR